MVEFDASVSCDGRVGGGGAGRLREKRKTAERDLSHYRQERPATGEREIERRWGGEEETKGGGDTDSDYR